MKRTEAKCEYCHRVLPRAEDFASDEEVMWKSNPFHDEIHGDETPHWICGKCHSEWRDEI